MHAVYTLSHNPQSKYRKDNRYLSSDPRNDTRNLSVGSYLNSMPQHRADIQQTIPQRMNTPHERTHSPVQAQSTQRYSQNNLQPDHTTYYPIQLYNSNSNGRPRQSKDRTDTARGVHNQHYNSAEGKRTFRPHYDDHSLGDNVSDGGTTTSGSYTVEDMDSLRSLERPQGSVCV